jgi:hypothetical protein
MNFASGPKKKLLFIAWSFIFFLMRQRAEAEGETAGGGRRRLSGDGGAAREHQVAHTLLWVATAWLEVAHGHLAT